MAGRGERFVGAVAVTGVGGIEVGQQQFESGAGEIVLELLRDQGPAAGLRVELEPLRGGVGAKDVAHPNRPELAANARQRQILDVQSAIEEERKARAELVYVQAAFAKQVDVSEAVGKGVGCLLH